MIVPNFNANLEWRPVDPVFRPDGPTYLHDPADGNGNVTRQINAAGGAPPHPLDVMRWNAQNGNVPLIAPPPFPPKTW
jgi:hypothetical protein